MKNKNLVYVLMLVFICFSSCKKENNNDSKSQGTIQFGFGQSKFKSESTKQTPSAVIITIADSKSKVVVESKKVALINMNGSYLSEPLSLTTGNYNITKFIVVNSSDSVIYATPLKDSKLAYLVNTPLPLAFGISKDNVTKITLEVISAKNAKFEDFGYDSFSFDIVNTFDFLTTVMVYNESMKNWELTSANITIKSADNSIAYTGALTSITNQITLRDNSTSFSIAVSKEGYQTYTSNFTADELKLFFKSEDKGPLIIKLLSESNTVTDIDGNVYHTIVIGTQVWMVENLKVTKYNDGIAIPNVTNNVEWAALTTPGYCWYNNDISYKNPYGALYNWYAVNTAKLAPTGWHVPTDEDWAKLTNYLITNGYNFDGTTIDNKIGKSMAETTKWNLSAGKGAIGNTDFPIKRNISGFSAFPSGGQYDGVFEDMGIFCSWWCSTPNGINNAWYRNLYYYGDALGRFDFLKSSGLSVRCIKD